MPRFTPISVDVAGSSIPNEREMMMMTDEEYVAIEGRKCPRCGDEQIEGGSVEIEAGCAYQEMWCNSCLAKWWDEYHLHGYVYRGRG